MTPNSNRHLVHLLGTVFIIVTSGCGRTGISMPPSGSDAGIATGGSTDSQTTNSQGATSSAGSSGQAGVHSSGASSSQGGVIASAGVSSLGSVSSWAGGSAGGSSSLGGVTASAGNRTSSAGGGDRGGAGSGGTASQGGVSSLAGSGGWGGTSITGGAKSSGGSTSSATATRVTPREPLVHRSQALSCVGVFAPPEPVSVQSGSCKKHADCKERKGGYCVLPSLGIGRAVPSYYCVYEECAADADCGTDKVCYCTPNDVPRCLYAGNCRTDADCGGGAGYCSPSNGYDCSGTYRSTSGYYCHTTRDTCIDDRDCTGKDYCDYDPIDNRWECRPVNITCIIG